MRADREDRSTRDELDAVLAEYLQRVDQGESVDPEEFISTNPEWAVELRDYFSQERALARSDVVLTADFVGPSTPGNALQVRCPSCHVPVELAVDTPLTDVKCSSCGSNFSLIDQGQVTQMAPCLSKLGRFELIERIGLGGFGSVWKARDKELDRTVAVKVPRRGGMTAEEQEKFLREARAAAQLRHPNIVSVHEVGRDEDSVYIVSDFVRGVTLSDFLTGQQPTCRDAAELCAKIAEALEHAHEQGVIHRDLKPANIMIDGDGQPHLMDFGLARRELGEVTMTLDGQVLGTPAYMSPEQAQGDAHTADRRSDVYSLGVILFQLLTGELPFRGSARMLMHQVIHDEPPSPRKYNSSVSRDLETITLKCLEKEPQHRYATASEVANELHRFLDDRPIQALPSSRLQLAWRWSKRNPQIAILVVLLITSLLSGTAISTVLAVRSQRNAIEYRRERDRAEANLEKYKISTASRYVRIARQLVLTDSRSVSDTNRAVYIAKAAQKLAPHWYVESTLGLAYYRAGRFEEAIRVLRLSRKKYGSKCFASDSFLLAMAYSALDDKETAERWFEAAECWICTFGADGDDLLFRREAAGALHRELDPFESISENSENRKLLSHLIQAIDPDAIWARSLEDISLHSGDSVESQHMFDEDYVEHGYEQQFVDPPMSKLRKSIGELQEVVFRVQYVEVGRYIYFSSTQDYYSFASFVARVEPGQFEKLEVIGITIPDEVVGKVMRVKGNIEERSNRIQVRVTDVISQLEIVPSSSSASDLSSSNREVK